MINLSRKAASRFSIDWQDLSERSGDNWKIDTIMAGRIPILLIVHEYTLFSLVRRKSEFKTIEQIALEIKRCCSWYRYVGQITVGKNTDKKLNGSINEMTRITGGVYSVDKIDELEITINNCLYTYLSKEKYKYGKPVETVDKYSKGLWPYLH